MKKNTKLFFTYFIFISLISSCINYSAGNRVTLDYPLNTDLNFAILRIYLDSLSKNDTAEMPINWKQNTKLLDTNPEDTWRIYFKSDPKEMYLIQINGDLILADVYNPKIVDYDWVAIESRMPKNEKARIMKRVKEQILDKILLMAKRDGCPDSILYFKPKYKNGNWTKSPKWHN